MTIKLTEHNSGEYNEMVELRTEILRKPLGLSFTKEQLEKEKDDFLIVAAERNKVIGCCILSACSEGVAQLRQMAVSDTIQLQGLGKKIISFAELVAKENNYNIIMLHARNLATGFYLKCGYSIKGDMFTEVGIPHFYMEKQLV